MPDKPLVSIITPTYNHDKFIGQCIESVLSQSLKEWELFVIDDCSVDKTFLKAENYASNDERIKVISHSKRWGMHQLNKTYNQALELCSGKFVAVLEGDDFWPVDKLEKQVPDFEDTEIILGFGKCKVIFSQEHPADRNWYQPGRDNTEYFNDYKGNFVIPLLRGPCFIPSSTVMIRKKYLLEIDGFQQPQGLALVDHPTWLQLSRMGKFFGSSHNLGFYRRHMNSQSLENIIEGTAGERDLVYNYLDKKITDDTIKNLTGNNKNRLMQKIKKNWTMEMIHAHWVAGRYYLAFKNRRKAARKFLAGIFQGNLIKEGSLNQVKKRIWCFIGFVSTISFIPLERVIILIKGSKVSLFKSIKKELETYEDSDNQ